MSESTLHGPLGQLPAKLTSMRENLILLIKNYFTQSICIMPSTNIAQKVLFGCKKKAEIA